MSRLTVLSWLFGDDETTLYECRNCGTSLDDPDDACPECGSERIAEYQL